MEMPYDAMLAKADEAFEKNGWKDTNELFGVHVDNLDKVPTSEWLILLMHVLMMEYVNVAETTADPHCTWLDLKLTVNLTCSLVPLLVSSADT